MISTEKNTKIGVLSDSLDLSNNIELTPLIDVVFIVIVFLLLTANVRLLSLPVTVPESEDIPEVSNGADLTINITIDANSPGWHIDRGYFSDWLLFRAELLKKIAEKPDSFIAIAADQQADVQRFVKVLTLLQQQQIKNTHIILQQEK